jgi:hypothetical protein
MSSGTCSGTQRISTRQLADVAYRALRVASVLSGVAADAARDVVELERKHSRGLTVLDSILEVGPPLLVASCQSSSTGTDLHAGRASALLLAVPLVAVACESPPATLTIHELAHAGALEPALLWAARARRLQFALTATDGTPIVRVEPGHAASGPGWTTAWIQPLDVRLTVEGARESTPVPRGPPSCADLVVEHQTWERVARRARSYLV